MGAAGKPNVRLRSECDGTSLDATSLNVSPQSKQGRGSSYIQSSDLLEQKWVWLATPNMKPNVRQHAECETWSE